MVVLVTLIHRRHIRGVVDLAFLGGPSPSENEYRPVISTNSIPPFRRGRLFFLNRLLSRSLWIGGEGENKARLDIRRRWEL
jgi:hypothetical protein